MLLVNLFSLLFVYVYAANDKPKHLIYPPPASGAPTKVQLILGLGLPMDSPANTIIGYVVKCNYNLPYNASQLTDQQFYDIRRPKLNVTDSRSLLPTRYEIYRMIESSFYYGKACLLRTICEIASTPLNKNGSILSQLLHVFLTPSSTDEDYQAITDQQYLAAESIGLESRYKVDDDYCARVFFDCDKSLLKLVSKIY